MEPVSRKAQLGGRGVPVDFPEWAEVLEAAPLPERVREGYAITIRWYLSWCRRGRVGVDYGSAREFIEWAASEKQAELWKVERWREALRWFFREWRLRSVPAEGVEEARDSGVAGTDSNGVPELKAQWIALRCGKQNPHGNPASVNLTGSAWCGPAGQVVWGPGGSSSRRPDQSRAVSRVEPECS